MSKKDIHIITVEIKGITKAIALYNDIRILSAQNYKIEKLDIANKNIKET
jgi:hypothetical protein